MTVSYPFIGADVVGFTPKSYEHGIMGTDFISRGRTIDATYSTHTIDKDNGGGISIKAWS